MDAPGNRRVAVVSLLCSLCVLLSGPSSFALSVSWGARGDPTAGQRSPVEPGGASLQAVGDDPSGFVFPPPPFPPPLPFPPLRPILPPRTFPPPASACTLQQCDPNVYCDPGSNSACVSESFEETKWIVCIYSTRFGSGQSPQFQWSKGLAIGPVYLLRSAGSGAFGQEWVRVLRSAGIAEILTSYNNRTEDAFYDTQFANWTNWRDTVTPADAGSDPHAFLLTLSKDQDGSFGPSVVTECRDRGPAWLCKGKLGSFVRRGHELVLWGIFDTGNYDYITEYGFQDDGTITMRLGAAGYNNPNTPPGPTEAHMHDALWRVELDLNGRLFEDRAPAPNKALLTRHIEPEPSDPSGLHAVEKQVPFNGGFEGFEDWDPKQFNTLLVEGASTNAWGDQMGYELEPLRTGTARHFAQPPGGKNVWTQHDFWVTRADRPDASAWASPWKNPDDYLLPYINGESVSEGPLVLWYLTSAHHDPTDEDRDLKGNFAVTLTHWFGFSLRPHNFFDHNPLGGPSKCDP